MGNQLIILGCVGSYNDQLTADLVKFLIERGMQIQHASNRYQGQTHFAVGTGADLATAFEDADIKTAFVEITATGETTVEPITLQTVLDAVNEGRKEAAAFFRYEKREDKKKGKTDTEKKGGGASAKVTPDASDADEKPADEKTANAGTAQEGETGASALTQSADEGQTQETQGTTEGDTETA